MEKKNSTFLLSEIEKKCDIIIDLLNDITANPDFLISRLRDCTERQKKCTENRHGKLLTLKITGNNGDGDK